MTKRNMTEPGTEFHCVQVRRHRASQLDCLLFAKTSSFDLLWKRRHQASQSNERTYMRFAPSNPRPKGQQEPWQKRSGLYRELGQCIVVAAGICRKRADAERGSYAGCSRRSAFIMQPAISGRTGPLNSAISGTKPARVRTVFVPSLPSLYLDTTGPTEFRCL